MTKNTQKAIINQIRELLTELENDEIIMVPEKTAPMEMLTVKECTEVVKGISEHTIRKLVAQNRVRYIRTGEGQRGKILISKQSLIDYISSITGIRR